LSCDESGRSGENIFLDDKDRACFSIQWQKPAARPNGACWRIVVMAHHFHWVVKTPPGNLERVLKIRGVLFSRQRPYGEARGRRISLMDLRLRSNEARGPLARKPCRRPCFWPQPSLARLAKPAAGIDLPPRLGCGQNPLPQNPSYF